MSGIIGVLLLFWLIFIWGSGGHSSNRYWRPHDTKPRHLVVALVISAIGILIALSEHFSGG